MLVEAAERAAFPLAEVVWDLRLTTLTMVGAMLLGALIIAVTAKWRKQTRSAELSASDQLAEYRALYQEGAISKEEFEQLRAVLAGEMRRALDVPATANRPAVAPQTAKPGTPPPAAPAEKKLEPPADGVHPA